MKSSHSSNRVLNFKWLLGLILIVVSSLVHVAVLPYADLVLLSSTSATAIIFGIMLSVSWLGEKFDTKKDLPAIGLICLGCLMTVIFANSTEQ